MQGFPSPFGNDDEELFDEYDQFVPGHIPEPGPFLEAHTVLTGADHVAFHRISRDIFEDRKVYDMSFNYNLARLNLDTRHPDAGYRYAQQVDSPSVLHAEFTPTTPFCPQSHTLTIGSFRAWNGLADRHRYHLVRVRVHPMHHDAGEINDQLAELEDKFQETGSVTHVTDPSPEAGSAPDEQGQPEGQHRGPEAPF